MTLRAGYLHSVLIEKVETEYWNKILMSPSKPVKKPPGVNWDVEKLARVR